MEGCFMKIFMLFSFFLGFLILGNEFYAMDELPGYQKTFHCDACKILHAASTGNLALIRELLDAGIDVNSRCPNFTIANIEEFEDICSCSSEELINRDTEDTPLAIAIRHGQREAAQLLIANHADLFAVNSKGKTPLHLATDSVILRDLLETIRARFFCLALAEHERIGEKSPAKLLGHYLNQAIYGLIINMKDHEGCTPLYAAVEKGTAAMVLTLLNAGADVKEPNNHGIAPLHRAAGRPGIEAIAIAQSLIAYGAQIKAPAYDNKDALFFAQFNGDKEQTMLHYLQSQVTEQ